MGNLRIKRLKRIEAAAQKMQPKVVKQEIKVEEVVPEVEPKPKVKKKVKLFEDETDEWR